MFRVFVIVLFRIWWFRFLGGFSTVGFAGRNGTVVDTGVYTVHLEATGGFTWLYLPCMCALCMSKRKADDASLSHHKVVLEVGGTKKGSRPSELPPGAVVIDLRALPNPYTSIKNSVIERKPKAIVDWMCRANPRVQTEVTSAIQRAVHGLADETNVRIQCHGGRDRSQAVAWHVLESLDVDTLTAVELRCLDADRMPGL